MCILCICKTRPLTENEIDECWNSNKHGAGIAWVDDKKYVNYIKGIMDLDEFKQLYSEMVSEGTLSGTHIVHFRISTANGVVPELTHPFIVSDESPLKLTYRGKRPVLFHNGVISSWKDKLIGYYERADKKIPDGLFSDTRYVAIRLAKLGPNALDYYDGKYVMLSPTMMYRYGQFMEEDGIMFSNGGYKSYKAKDYKDYDYSKWRNKDDKPATGCGATSFLNRPTSPLIMAGNTANGTRILPTKETGELDIDSPEYLEYIKSIADDESLKDKYKDTIATYKELFYADRKAWKDEYEYVDRIEKKGAAANGDSGTDKAS